MSILDKYSDIHIKNKNKPNIYIGTNNDVKYIIKLLPIDDDFIYFKTERILKYNEMTFDINVNIIEMDIIKYEKLPKSISVYRRRKPSLYYGIIVMDYMDGEIDKLWLFIDNNKRTEIKSIITEKIDKINNYRKNR